jgi:riboflavin biosynthesis pyrimidine reductase
MEGWDGGPPVYLPRMERLLPDPGPTSVDEQLGGYEPWTLAGEERPFTFTNFVLSVDGHATLEGRAGTLGSRTDIEMLMGLRACADAVMVGAGTMRVERYGRLLPDPSKRALRERRGLPHDPLAVLVSGSLDLPWDAGMFTCGAGRVLIFTASEEDPPPTATPVRVVRHEGRVDLSRVVHHLRKERGIRALLSEGGPHLHGELAAAGLVDEMFVTRSPMLAGGMGPGLMSGLPERGTNLELAWLLREESELFARYRVLGD